MHNTCTSDLIDMSTSKSAIRCKWVYTIKTQSDDTIDRYMTRLIANGFTQKYEIDYEETFAPLACLFLCLYTYCGFCFPQLATVSNGCEECLP